jgi:hypothetical protein
MIELDPYTLEMPADPRAPAIASVLLFWRLARVAIRITYVTLADGTPRQRRNLPLMIKMVLPFAPNVKCVQP